MSSFHSNARMQVLTLPSEKDRGEGSLDLCTSVPPARRPGDSASSLANIAIAGASSSLTQELIARVLTDHPFAVAGLTTRLPATLAVITGLYESSPAGSAISLHPARRAAQIVESLRADGLALLDGDDPLVRRLAKHCPAAVTWIGTSAGCHLRATHVEEDENGRLSFAIAGQTFRVNGCDAGSLSSALAAIAVGRIAGLDDAEIARRLSSGEPRPTRSASLRIRSAPRARPARSLPMAHWLTATVNRAA